ncbi:uncharacterized protein CEXT_446191 [Caerostris extrusa]|uniref:Uncharacterized protein n=1 Tax=Caerostris extrusa TaxID=172846 RepID=A0AAV4PH56_CAEEX|nr:uncharacterized protein CEXT_446191 [Caerostris extrusa]
MVKIDELFDDLRIARAGIRKWTTETLTDFSEEEEKQISHLLDHVTHCVQLFHRIAGEASIYKPMDPNLLKAAVLQYGKGLKHGGESYRQLFLRLKEDIGERVYNVTITL